MASEVSICNRALQRLGSDRISALDEDSKNGRACNAAYESLRDAAIRSHPWSFAISRAALAADSDAPVGDDAPDLQYTWPTDALRILLPKDYTLDWIVEGRKILTNWTAPLYIRYIAKIKDVNTMDPLFREFLAKSIAHELCEEITGSNTKQAKISEEMKELLMEARRVNAIEKIAVESPPGSWDEERK